MIHYVLLKGKWVIEMGIWQIIWICIMAISLGVNLALHGKPKKGNNNFFVALISFGIQLVPLIFGGFFTAG